MSRRQSAAAAALAFGASLGVAACSTFNLTPACDSTVDGLRRTLATDGSVTPDWQLLRAIIAASRVTEEAAAYNERICQALVEAGGASALVRYKVAQVEGVQSFYEIDILNIDDGDVQGVIVAARSAYVAGA